VRKRKTEVDAQLGPAISIGRKHGIDMPLASQTITFIHEIEAGLRPLSLTNLDDLEGLSYAAAPT
jgi:2-dehydropantoate 2-reductase